METRVEKTIELRKKGYNCAQAVACAYCDLVDVDEKTMFRLAEGMGAGLGNMEGVCGALTGACMLAGAKGSTARTEAPDSKGKTYKLTTALAEAFKTQNGSIICRELKGASTGRVLRACPDCIRDAARMAEELLFSEE